MCSQTYSEDVNLISHMTSAHFTVVTAVIAYCQNLLFNSHI